jgi:hypothetical protein
VVDISVGYFLVHAFHPYTSFYGLLLEISHTYTYTENGNSHRSGDILLHSIFISNLEGGCHQEEAPLDPQEQGEGGHHGCQAVQGWPGQLEPEEVQAVIVFLLFVLRFG